MTNGKPVVSKFRVWLVSTGECWGQIDVDAVDESEAARIALELDGDGEVDFDETEWEPTAVHDVGRLDENGNIDVEHVRSLAAAKRVGFSR